MHPSLEEQKVRVEKVFDLWIERLHLQDWKIQFTWHEEPQDGYNFQCTTQWPYLRAFIDISLPDLFHRDDDDLERRIIHELMHTLVAEMTPGKVTDGEERVCTLLAMAFQRVSRGE